MGARREPYDVAEAVGRLGAGLICLQEDWVPAKASAHSGPDPVARAAALQGAALYRASIMTGVPRSALGIEADGGPGDLCISVLSALPVTGYNVVPLGCGPGDTVPRYAQILQLRLPGGGALRLVNTHLTFSVTSPLQLWRLWRELRTDAVPTVIAGDLNMPALAARRYAGLTGLVRGPTFPAGRPVIQLDHILVSRGIDGAAGRVLRPAGSDHRPVRAPIRFSGRS